MTNKKQENWTPASLDAVFEHVKGAIQNLERGDAIHALRNLEQIFGDLAYHTLKATEADPGSPHWMQLVRAVQEAFPPDDNWEEYVK